MQAVICTMEAGFMILQDHCIKIIHALSCHRCRTARAMGDRTRSMRIGDGSPLNVTSQDLMPRHFWSWWVVKHLLLLVTQLLAIKWSRCCVLCGRLLLILNFVLIELNLFSSFDCIGSWWSVWSYYDRVVWILNILYVLCGWSFVQRVFLDRVLFVYLTLRRQWIELN